MSTRSRIAIKEANGTYTSIYCHWDGYPSANGKILLHHYTDAATVHQLMSLGDISALGNTPHPNPNGWTMDSTERYNNSLCITYSGRGEICPATTSKDLDDLLKLWRDSWGEYLYIYDDGIWLYTYGDVLLDLTEEVIKGE